MSSSWTVKVSRLPNDIESNALAELFGIPSNLIHVRQSQNGGSPYAWVNGFASKALADKFVKRWNGHRIGSTRIVCVVSPTAQAARASSTSVMQRRRDPSEAMRRENRMQPARNRSPSPSGSLNPMTDDVASAPWSMEARNAQRPSRRMDPCSDGDQCEVFHCPNQHPDNRKKPCPHGNRCFNNVCLCLHPSDRKVCSLGVECKETDCASNHPPG